jgi:hypothetical protein
MSAPIATLLIPGYIASSPTAEAATLLPEKFSVNEDAEQMPWQAQLCQVLGWTEQRGDRLPSLALPDWLDNCEDADVNPASFVRADPIHLKADRDTASLIPPEELQLGRRDAQLFIDSINEFLKDDDVRIHQCNPEAWMMSGMPSQQLAAYPTSFVAHRHASAFLPDSDSDGKWRRLATEIQMLLHAHPLNQERERAGQLSVNALWYWGGATLPGLPESAVNSVLFADDAYAVALAEQWNIERYALQELGMSSRPLFEAGNTASNVIIVDTSLRKTGVSGDIDQYMDRVRNINQTYLLPLSSLVKKGQLSALKLQTEDGLVIAYTGSPRRWWQTLPWIHR